MRNLEKSTQIFFLDSQFAGCRLDTLIPTKLETAPVRMGARSKPIGKKTLHYFPFRMKNLRKTIYIHA
jgi:hypothetical protein